MLHGPLAGKLFWFALPIAASSMLQQLFNAADTAVVGKFADAAALAAVGTNGEIVAFIVSLSAGLAVGTNVLLGMCIGKGEKKDIHLQLPPQYAGCQIRGGDKITETNLLPPEHYIRLIKEKTAIRDVFVLTDDYRLFEQVQTLAPDIHWYTLCSPNEQGYVNSAFTQTTKELKQKQMARFLCSIQLLMDASVFIGSITTGPSLFLLKKFYPEINPADCLLKDFPQASVLPIPGRGRVATEFMQGNLKL